MRNPAIEAYRALADSADFRQFVGIQIEEVGDLAVIESVLRPELQRVSAVDVSKDRRLRRRIVRRGLDPLCGSKLPAPEIYAAPQERIWPASPAKAPRFCFSVRSHFARRVPFFERPSFTNRTCTR
jgi:hypothetical protein